jgi:hypothetical protein
MIKPKKLKTGFYYHYKHTPDASFNYHAYEVIGTGWHTEVKNEYFVIYRPLYKEAFVYKKGKIFDVRPLNMFLEKVKKDGKIFPRFKQIKDKKLIQKLTKIRNEMY